MSPNSDIYVTKAACEISNDLNTLMDMSGLSVREVAKRSGVGKSTVHRMTQGLPTNLSSMVKVFDSLGEDGLMIEWR